jgi:hypothetical protein
MSRDNPVAVTKNGIALPTCIKPVRQKPVEKVVLA